ncbi:hypothetical protein Micbo1qcDRAFT_169710, partial [Microdochium bolleyi]
MGQPLDADASLDPPANAPSHGDASGPLPTAADRVSASDCSSQRKQDYPGSLKLTVIIVSLCLALFLCGLV